MHKYVDEVMLSENFSIIHERFTQTVNYKVNEFTDVSFDIFKEGYIPITVFPRTSESGNVVLVGYRFYDESGQGDINLNKVTLTYHNLTNNVIVGSCGIDVHLLMQLLKLSLYLKK